MIKGLYETHLPVRNLENSRFFYEAVLGLSCCHVDNQRNVAFFWIGNPKQAMLGLWETPATEIRKQHLAFQCEKEDLLHRADHFFETRNINPYNFLNDGSSRPMVFAWMPALSIYFLDPDGHELEFIAVLEGVGRSELGVISYDDWINATTTGPMNG